MAYVYFFLVLLDEFGSFLTGLLDEMALLLSMRFASGCQFCLIVIAFLTQPAL